MKENELIEKLKGIAMVSLRKKDSPTVEDIETLVSQASRYLTSDGVEISDLIIKQTRNSIEADFGVRMELGSILKEQGHQPWLSQNRADNPERPYWNRYKEHLIQDKDFPPNVLTSLDRITNDILDLTADPHPEQPFDRKGLVVGQVQSGKTANYTGLICKAADAGYRIIIIIAGIHNSLRRQTQKRIDEGFIGRDSDQRNNTRRIAAGRYGDAADDVAFFTTRSSDFNTQTASNVGINLNQWGGPTVFVVKKNKSILENLKKWLLNYTAHASGKIELPAMIIDDEADNASIDVGRNETVSAINKQIRQLLLLFNKCSYVGYTATPFANIFIEPGTQDEMLGDDLFPRSFIIGLDPPTNYFGPERVFQSKPGEDPTISIEDYQDILPLNHKKDHLVTELPESLDKAIDSFILGIAIRLCRSHENFDASMMINASRFTDVQKEISDSVFANLEVIKHALTVHGARPDALNNRIVLTFKNLFDEDFADCGCSWTEVLERLPAAASPIEVRTINSKSADSLNYDDHEGGLRVIAVGGMSLSRGLTLEGLMVSYFLRNSKMYDTLMQMGRWFGYRPGYEDLVRIWLTEESAGWYEHITESIAQLRIELAEMQRNEATPAQYGLKIRSHPESLMITARNKMGSSETITHSVSLANRFIETRYLCGQDEAAEINRVNALDLLQNILSKSSLDSIISPSGRGFFAQDVDVSMILDFVRRYKNSSESLLTDPRTLCDYIESNLAPIMPKWNLFVPRGDGNPVLESPLGAEHTSIARTEGKRTKDKPAGHDIAIGNKMRISSPGIESTGLEESVLKAVKDEHERTPRGRAVRIADARYRAKRTQPLFALYFIELMPVTTGVIAPGQPYVGFGMSIPPGISEGPTVEYQVNKTYLKQMMIEFGMESEEDEE